MTGEAAWAPWNFVDPRPLFPGKGPGCFSVGLLCHLRNTEMLHGVVHFTQSGTGPGDLGPSQGLGQKV